MKNIILIGIIVTIFLILMTSCYTAVENDYDDYYGIIVQYNELKNDTYTRTQYGITNLINDLLRMNINVYWATENFSINAMHNMEGDSFNTCFNKGSFIIPFTSNSTKNKLISCITLDYKYGNEVEKKHIVDMYYFTESLRINTYPLNYAKVAYHLGDGVHYWLFLCYLDSFRQGGLFDHKIFTDDEIKDGLNNEETNLFIWPGANSGRGYMGINGNLKTAMHIGAYNKIRDFVANGGGYVGSCYGAAIAASGLLLPYNLLYHNIKNIPCILNLGLTASSYTTNSASGYIEVKIINMSHPVSYGLNQTHRTYRGHGPVYNWLGEDTHAIAILTNMTNQFKREELEGIPDWLIEKLIEFEIGNPIWITSTFGNGKVVTFGDHPEVPEPYKLDRLMHNSLYYTTSEDMININFTNIMNIHDLLSIYNKTNNISLEYTGNVFLEIWEKTNYIFDLCKKLDNNEIHVMNTAIELFEEGKINNNLKTLILGEYRDSYQRWISMFMESLQIIERVNNKTNRFYDISSEIFDWQVELLDDLEKCENVCIDLIDMSNELGEKLNSFTGEKFEKSLINILANKRDDLFRRGSNFFIQPFMKTTKTYRELWYNYEVFLCENLYNETKQKINKTSYSKLSSDIDFIKGKIFVDDDAKPGGNGSIFYPYQSVEDAVEISSDGDIIYVFEGSYPGDFAIDKSITLIGEDMNTTIINGCKKPRHTVTISGQNVEVSGFTITNSSKEMISCGLILQGSNNSIYNTKFNNCRTGLGFRPKSSNNIIRNNYFINNTFAGLIIDEQDSINNSIINNFFINNTAHGIYTVNIPNIISKNSFINNGVTIYPDNAEMKIAIDNNTVNGKPILYLNNQKNFNIYGEYGQIILSKCENITLDTLKIDSVETGVYVIDSKYIRIKDCEFNCKSTGISIQYSSDNVVEMNTIQNSMYCGIYIHHSENNEIKNNEMISNDEGILLISSDNNLIEDNLLSCNIVGLSFWLNSNLNQVLNNCFIENKENTIDKCRNIYKNNYWDDWAGLNGVLLKNLPYNIPIKKFSNFDWEPSEILN